MASLRSWIVGAAVASFAAGAFAGYALAPHGAGLEIPPAEQAYAADLGQRYGLRSAQVRQLRHVLQHQREREIAILLTAQGSHI